MVKIQKRSALAPLARAASLAVVMQFYFENPSIGCFVTALNLTLIVVEQVYDSVCDTM